MVKFSDVVIVGAGIIGSAVAYFLQRQQIQCTLLERDGIASQASGWAAGELSPFSRAPMPNSFTKFCVEGLRTHWEHAPSLIDETGIDYHLASIPVYRPAFNEQEVEGAQLQLDLYKELGMEASWLTNGEITYRDSWLSPTSLGAVYTESEAQLDPRLLTMALAKSAEIHGARIESCEATGLIIVGDCVKGVQTRDGVIPSNTVVLAMGPWSVELQSWVGFNVPVIPLRGQIVHLKMPGELPNHAIFHHSGYVLPKSTGLVFAGTTEEQAGFDSTPTEEGIASIMKMALGLAPRLQGGKIADVTACLRPLSVDELPIIGPVPGWRNLFVGTGHGRKGILLGLATGKYMAQQITDGIAEYPLDDFSPGRFVS